VIFLVAVVERACRVWTNQGNLREWTLWA